MSQRLTFRKWLAEVDKELVALSTLDMMSIEDCDYLGCYEAGDSPEEAARYALEQAGFPEDALPPRTGE